jgi:hypothetical protein
MYLNKMKVINLDRNLVEWDCVEANPDWLGTHVKFQLEEQPDKIIVRFTQSGWKETSDFFADCNFNWGRYLVSLKNLCETGKGSPFGS